MLVGIKHHTFSECGKKTGCSETARMLGPEFFVDQQSAGVRLPADKLEQFQDHIHKLMLELNSTNWRVDTVRKMAQRAQGLANQCWMQNPYRSGWHLIQVVYFLSSEQGPFDLKKLGDTRATIKRLSELPKMLKRMSEFRVDPILFMRSKYLIIVDASPKRLGGVFKNGMPHNIALR